MHNIVSSTAKKDRHLTKAYLVLNVNEATAEELQTLPDVGPVRAERHYSGPPYQSVNGLFEKRALPKTVVDANRTLLKTTGKNERTTHHIDQKAKGAFVSESALHISMAVSRILSA